MFGDPLHDSSRWQTSRLAEICNRVTDGTHQPPRWGSSGIPFLFVSNIVDGEISFRTKKFISEETWKGLTTRCPIHKNDILYTTVGSYGNAAIVDTDRKFAFQRHIAHIKPDTRKVDSQFLVAMLQSPGVRHQADRQARGVAQKTLNLKELKEFIVFVPPMSAQKEFVRAREQVLAIREKARVASHESANLFGSLSLRAFRGEF